MSAPTAHTHIVLKATGLGAAPRDAAAVCDWLARLVDAVGMTLLIGPFARRCEDAGNEGVTGLVGITTSHASIHVWDTGCTPHLEMDLYSCAPFGSGQVLALIQEFAPTAINWTVFDRSSPTQAADLMEHGTWAAHP
jgi:S-adenosylmethionine/arginine decarboxylase-like enzyme